MDDLNAQYEQLVKEGDTYFKQLETAELCLTAIIDYMFRYGDLTDKLTVQDILIAVHRIEIALRAKILDWRLEKALIACELKKVQYH